MIAVDIWMNEAKLTASAGRVLVQPDRCLRVLSELLNPLSILAELFEGLCDASRWCLRFRRQSASCGSHGLHSRVAVLGMTGREGES